MSSNHERILIVESDPQTLNLIGYSLETAGFRHISAVTGEEALRRAKSERVDIMLLDPGLPDIEGMEVIRRLREWSQMPVIVVSARSRDIDKAAALDLGADDYISKPFSAYELLARVRVAARHLRMLSGCEALPLRVGGLEIDFAKRLVSLDGSQIHVTPLEYSLLSLLFRNAGKVVATQLILREIYGAGYGSDTQALRALVHGLRCKLERDTSNPRYIITDTGVGYRLAGE